MIKYIHKLIASRERSNYGRNGNDRQTIKGFIRFLIKDLKAVEKEENKDKQQEQIKEIIDILQQTLED